MELGIIAAMNFAAQPQPKWKTALFHSVFILMFLMAYHFFKERLYADSAYYIFHSIDSGSFVTANQRFVLGISELISLGVYYLGGSLKVILITWSLSHVLFYYVLFIIVYHFHKSGAAGLAIILLQVLGQLWLYYSPMLEICYGAALLVVFLVLLSEKKFTPGRWFWLIVLEILILTSHPENFILFFFVIMSDIFRNGFKMRVHLTFFSLLLAVIVFKSLNWSEYEGGKLGYMLDLNQNHLYENLWNASYMADVLSIFTTHYRVLLVFFLLTLAALLVRKQWRMLLLFLFCSIGLIVLVNATNFAREFTRYNESLYYPLVPLITITFLSEFYLYLESRLKPLVLVLLVGISIYQLGEIKKNGDYLKLRTFQMEEMIRASRENGSKKSLARLENVEKERWVLNWSYPMETLLLSSLAGPAGTVSLIADEDYDYRDTSIVLTPERFILRRWEIRDVKNLLPYFQMTSGNYIPLNTLDTSVSPGTLSGKVALELQINKAVEAYDRIFIPVKISNHSGVRIPSLPVDENYLTVEIRNGDRSSFMKIPFDIDIRNQYTEVVSCPFNDIPRPYDINVKLMIANQEITGAVMKMN